jgi:hypothetical protein
MKSRILQGLGLASPWSQEAVMALVALGLGFGVMPVLIYQAGSMILGRYEGASAARIYDTIYQGLYGGSVASVIVVFGPYALYLMFKALRLWWRAGAKPG